MPSEERPERERSAAEEREIARRRDELIAAAKGERTGGPGSGARLAGLGLQFVIAILLCLFAGQWLDRRLGSAPWFLLAGVLVGAAAGFYSLYRALVAENRRLDEEERK
ncbi:MAG TPA: AtpZ/AtpI family protein [Gemmatimonadaceae bacterium]|nr:AtpZ/AtpI family protein [Gemmatimonadaceae bacterium]